MAKAVSRKGRARRRTRTLFLTTALGTSLLAAQAFAADECGPAPAGGGSVECTTAGNTYDNGITYTVPDDLTVVLDDGVIDHKINAGGTNDALSVTSTYHYSNVTITGPNADVTADVGRRDGVYVNHSYAGAQGQTHITVRDVTGQTNGIQVSGGGLADITATSVTGGDTGVYVSGQTAGNGVTIHVGNADQSGGGGTAAIKVVGSVYGDIYVQSDHVTSDSAGFLAQGAAGGLVTVKVAAVDTAGDGVVASSYNRATDITAGLVLAGGKGLQASDSGSGQVSIVADHVVSSDTAVLGTSYTGSVDLTVNDLAVSGNNSVATVKGQVTGTTGGGVTITTTAASVYASGDSARAIQAETTTGDIVVNAGTVGTLGANIGTSADAILARSSSGGNVTVNLANGQVATAGDQSYGVRALAYGGGGATVTQTAGGSVKTYGYDAMGIVAVANTGTRAVTINSYGSVTTYGAGSGSTYGGANAILGLNEGSGDVSITSNQTSTVGDYSFGVEGVALNGDVTIHSTSASTQGYSSPGVGGYARHGDVAITAGTVNTLGNQSAGVTGYAPDGNVSITTSGDVTTSGSGSRGIDARGYTGVTVTNQGQVHTDTGVGIRARSYGPITITSHVVVSDQGTGIDASSEAGDVVVTADSTTSNRTSLGSAIEAYSYDGNVTVTAGVVNANVSANARGVHAISYNGDVTVTAHNVLSGSNGIYAESYYGSAAATVTSGGHVGTFGTTADAVLVVAENTGDATIVATDATIVTSGNESDGLHAIAGYYSGDASITGGTVTTLGDASRGVSATSYYGTATANVQLVSTSGNNSTGVRVRGYGDASATVTTVQTAGAYSRGVDVQSRDGAASATVTSATTTGYAAAGVLAIGYTTASANAGLVLTRGAYSSGVAVYAYQGAASATVATVQTAGAYSYGVTVGSYLGAATATVTSVVTAGYGASGVKVRGDGDASATVGTARTSGTYAYGVDVRSYHGAASATVTSVTTTGDDADGVRVRGYGAATATVGTVQTAGAYAYGVNVRSSNGAAGATVTSVTTTGDDATGVRVRGYGAATVTAGTVRTSGYAADGVDAQSSNGGVSVTAADVTTSGDGATGVYAVGGNGAVTITTTSVATSGVYGVGIQALGYGSGGVSVSSGTLSTSGADGLGIVANSIGGDVTVASTSLSTSGASGAGIIAGASGAVSVTSGALSTTGPYAVGIVALSGSGPVTITSTNLSTSGASAPGIIAGAGGALTLNATTTTVSGGAPAIIATTDTGDITGTVGTLTSAGDGVISTSYGSTQTWTLGTVTAGGAGILVKNPAGHATTLNLTNVTAGTFAAEIDEDAATVNVASGGLVKGGSSFGVGFNNVESGAVNNAGTLTSSNGLAVWASAASGPISISNAGLVAGAVTLGGGADSFTNAAGAVFAAKSSDFGAGSDLLSNSGTVSFDAGQTPVTVTFNGLEQFNNTGGLVDLRGRGAGDKLVLSGGFAGSGDSRVGLDVYLGGPTSPSDVLQVGGAVTGTTSLLIHDTNTGAGALAPDGIVVVDANAGSASAGAFTLAGGPINKGLFTYDLYLRNDKRYVLASRWSPTAQQGPFLTTALEQLYQETQSNIDDRLGDLRAFDTADSGTIQLAALTSDASGPLPRGRTEDNGVWARLTAGGNDRVASHSQTVLGVTTVDNLNFNQSYVAIQGGFDHAFRGAGGTWIAGASLGYLDSDGSFAKGGSFSFTGPSAALYLEYLKGGLFGEVTAKGDWLNLKYRSMVGNVSPDAHTYGVSGTMGYRMHGPGWFAEPEGSLSYGRGRIDNFNLGGASFVFHDGETLRGRAALNLGSTFTVNHGKAIVEPMITAAAVKEFLGDNLVDVNAGGPVLHIGDGAKATWGEFGGGVRVIDTSSGFSAFVQGKYEGLSKVNTGFGFKAGVRFSF